MAKLYFKHGAMGSGKSMLLISTAYNYRGRGKEVLVLKSATDNRNSDNEIVSRTGARINCEMIDIYDDIKIKVHNLLNKGFKYSAILIDEVQFLKQTQVYQLSQIVDDFNIPVLCYGLKVDFKSHLFEASKRLLELADETEELKTMCSCPDCNKKAIMNMRFNNGIPVVKGDVVQVGDEEYLPYCRKHYFEIIRNNELNNIYNNRKHKI